MLALYSLSAPIKIAYIIQLYCYSDFESLSTHDIKGNCKKAFDAGEKLGIPRVIDPSDMHMLAGKFFVNI